jgi:hypothetical protein
MPPKLAGRPARLKAFWNSATSIAGELQSPPFFSEARFSREGEKRLKLGALYDGFVMGQSFSGPGN